MFWRPRSSRSTPASVATSGYPARIGRLREITFRKVGEGSGKALDLDRFDDQYTHVFLWHKEKACIAGAYRLAWTQDLIEPRFSGLYTSTLFHYAPGFFKRLGPSVELGRSFIRNEFQRDYAPLLLLWQAIARCVARRPSSPVLFGPVSISASYSDASRDMIFRFLSEKCFRDDLAGLIISGWAAASLLSMSIGDFRIRWMAC